MSSWSDDGIGLQIENPFFHRGPIRDPEYFFDREKETRYALSMLGKGQSVSVIGPRKIGKTSMLFHLSRPEIVQGHGLDPSRYVFVYINCEDLGHLEQEAIYALLTAEVAERIAQHGHTVTIPPRPVSHLEFEHAIGAVFACGLNMVMLFDEFELLSQNENLGLSFFSGLRALATRFGLAYLTSSGRPLLRLRHTDDYSPFFNIFVPLKLCLLDEKASRELIDRSLIKARASLLPEIVDHVLMMGGGHPFFLQVAGYWALELQDAKNAPLTSGDIHLLEQSVRGQIESHLAYYWKHLSDTECYVLAALSFTQDEERFREELESLAALCLIVKADSQHEDGWYRYFSPLFSEFARRQQVEGLLQAGPFVLDLAHRRALRREEPLALSTSQYDLFVYLLERQGQVISSQELDQEALGIPGESYEYLSDERLKSAIKGLRKALGEDAGCVENKRGIGYTFRVRSPEEV